MPPLPEGQRGFAARPLASLTPPALGAVGRGPSLTGAERQDTMLRIYETIVDLLGKMQPVIAAIAVHDRDLARQLRRAGASIALNVAEGSGSNGGTRRERYRNALGSAREAGACLDLALAWGYVDGLDGAMIDQLDKVRATLVKNVV